MRPLAEPDAISAADSPDEPVGPLVAVVRHPILTLVQFVVLIAAAAAIGLTHRATDTAEARVAVGQVNVPAYTLQNVIQGNATLAVDYARAIGAAPVTSGASNRAPSAASA